MNEEKMNELLKQKKSYEEELKSLGDLGNAFIERRLGFVNEKISELKSKS